MSRNWKGRDVRHGGHREGLVSGDHCNEMLWAQGLTESEQRPSDSLGTQSLKSASVIGWGNARRTKSLARKRMTCSGGCKNG